MTPIVGDTVQYKNNSRDAEPLPGIVVNVHNGKVDINIFRLGVMGFRRNVTLAKDAASTEAGQCWLLKRS